MLCSPDRTSRLDRPAVFARPISSSTAERSDFQAGRVARRITLAPRGPLHRRGRRPGSATREQADLATSEAGGARQPAHGVLGRRAKALQVIREARASIADTTRPSRTTSSSGGKCHDRRPTGSSTPGLWPSVCPPWGTNATNGRSASCSPSLVIASHASVRYRHSADASRPTLTLV